MNCDILLLQEHWLYESEVCKIEELGDGVCLTAASSMDKSVPRLGRRHGGCAIIWRLEIS